MQIDHLALVGSIHSRRSGTNIAENGSENLNVLLEVIVQLFEESDSAMHSFDNLLVRLDRIFLAFNSAIQCEQLEV